MRLILTSACKRRFTVVSTVQKSGARYSSAHLRPGAEAETNSRKFAALRALRDLAEGLSRSRRPYRLQPGGDLPTIRCPDHTRGAAPRHQTRDIAALQRYRPTEPGYRASSSSAKAPHRSGRCRACRAGRLCHHRRRRRAAGAHAALLPQRVVSEAVVSRASTRSWLPWPQHELS